MRACEGVVCTCARVWVKYVRIVKYVVSYEPLFAIGWGEVKMSRFNVAFVLRLSIAYPLIHVHV